ncbi:orotate phosphoribosyltransferase [Candidatus Woesearchaeota archaeon CG10_big_fil_rev_8_21_14_0_10_44_13]|nr:MAG: orotate phosphoribosyltransferase [Candidatus Woesearchaeota archaeon CG10_big_fil_rev_8_21_14_0_10_44_13]
MEHTENIKMEAAKILLDIKAVTLNLEKPYRYTSGILSPIYCDNRLLMSYPEKLDKMIDYMLNLIITHIGINNIDVIGGTSTAGIPYAAILSERLNLPMIYLKKDKEEHGKYNKIEGVLKNNQRVLIVEDLISTGGSSFAAVETVREAGGIVNECIAIFTYELEKAGSVFSEGKCSLHTLTNFLVLMKVAEKERYVTQAEKEKALEWNKDTAGWAKKMGYE